MAQIRCQHKNERKQVIIASLWDNTCICKFQLWVVIDTIFRYPKALFEFPKFDEVMNRQNIATIRYPAYYCDLKMC